MKATGVKLTKHDLEAVILRRREAEKTPVIWIAGRDMALVAWKDFLRFIDNLATEKYGLPKTNNYYSLNTETGELFETEDSDYQ